MIIIFSVLVSCSSFVILPSKVCPQVKKALSLHFRQSEEGENSEFLSRFTNIDITDADSVMKVCDVETLRVFLEFLFS